jgi:hypothetical protein
MPIGSVNQARNDSGTVVNAIAHAAERSGVSFDYLLAQARLESSLDPKAKAGTSSASGLFQFTKQSWLATLDRHGSDNGYGWAASAVSQGANGHYAVADPTMRQQILDLRFDPQASSLMAAAFAEDNAAHLRERLGSEPEQVDLYLAHFLGAHGAAKFLTAWRANPDAAAAPIFPKPAAANQAIFYRSNGEPRSLNDIRERFRSKMAEAGAKPLPTPMQHPMQITQAAPPAPSPASEPLRHPAMQSFEPMPGRLSLAFAERAYARLSGMGNA